MEERPDWMVEVVQRATTNYIVFPGPTELQLRETINWERATQPNPAHWTSIGGELYDPHAQEQPQLVVRRLDQVVADENPITGAGGFLKERTGEAQETYPDHDETTYEANETTTLAVTTAPDESVSAAVWSATQPPPTNFVQNPSVNYSQLPQATPSQMLTQTVDAPQLRLDPMLVTPLDKTRQRIEEAVYDKPLINILAAIVALEHVAVPYGVTRTRWTLGDFTGATLKVTLFGNAVQWNPYVKVGDVIHLTGITLSVYNDSVQGTGGDRSTLEIAHRILAETEEDELYVLAEVWEAVIPAVKATLTVARWYETTHLHR